MLRDDTGRNPHDLAELAVDLSIGAAGVTERERARHAREALDDVRVVPQDAAGATRSRIEAGVRRQVRDGPRLQQVEPAAFERPLAVLRLAERRLQPKRGPRHVAQLLLGQRRPAAILARDVDGEDAAVRRGADCLGLLGDDRAELQGIAPHLELVRVELSAHQPFSEPPHRADEKRRPVQRADRVARECDARDLRVDHPLDDDPDADALERQAAVDPVGERALREGRRPAAHQRIQDVDRAATDEVGGELAGEGIPVGVFVQAARADGDIAVLKPTRFQLGHDGAADGGRHPAREQARLHVPGDVGECAIARDVDGQPVEAQEPLQGLRRHAEPRRHRQTELPRAGEVLCLAATPGLDERDIVGGAEDQRHTSHPRTRRNGMDQMCASTDTAATPSTAR